MSNVETTDIVQSPSTDTLKGEITSLNNGTGVAGFYTSMKAGTFAERMSIAKALSDSKSLADEALGKTINLANLIIQSTEMTNEATGEIQTVPRVILVDDKGAAFHAISGPLYRDVTNLLGIAGEPHQWDSAIPVKVTREGTGTRKYFSLSYV